jgi:hypothetical protein
LATTWVFQRGDRRMYAQRQDRRRQVQLIIWSAGDDERAHLFDDELAFVAFMSDFERDALQNGWSLADFIPERRRGGDRRAQARGQERRRPAAAAGPSLITFPKKGA